MTDPSWRIGIAGAGAIGTTLAVRLALSGHAVGVLARGGTLDVIRRNGLRLTDLDGTHEVRVEAGGPGELGERDVVFLCAKAQDLAPLATAAGGMIGPDTLVVPIVNGIPWWYFEGVGGRNGGRTVQAVDPDGRLKALLPLDRVIGAVAFITAERLAPGVAHTANPLRMIIGEITHDRTARAERLGAALGRCGIATQVSDRLRDPLWTKVIANLTSNPLSVVAGATLRDIYGAAELSHIARQLLDEALLTAAAHGARVELDPAAFLAMGAGMGAVKTSMLQDFEKGLPLELSSICDAVIELAELHNLPMPLTKTIASLARFKSAQAAGQPIQETGAR
ncbi:2-dehydropantoate 2-reductase [Azospirillum sp. TSO35-2]|uniref:ketopantoate reductase family protein n=1 Tax=Azospirillum sp. TSO35-2 TaxID=716796 RepID=UPI000D61E923|nr:2-dehydropantoate 2-reductase [Azospirillum sp. TSO35-2]PWC39429.1 2-dehydropantoate 2-reductase [Azospirillum sp. TSO35-2]